MSAPELTPAAQQLADCWTRLQAVHAACTEALHAGDWVLLNDEAGELSVIADEVSAAAAALTRDATPTSPAELLAAIEAIGERPSE